MSSPRLISTNLYQPASVDFLLSRLDQLTPNHSPSWGRMNATQMLHHLNRAIGCGLDYFDFKDKSNILTRTIVKWIIFYVLKTFPHNAKTPKPLRVVADYDFEEERTQLKEIIRKALETKSDGDWKVHPYFGPLTRKEWGILIMIHVHYHLKQFQI